jgi:pyruvate dehydrogenase (quinone)
MAFAVMKGSYITGNPVVVCGTAGPGVTHLFNGLMDTAALEELNPYKFFDTASLYVGRVVNAGQARAVINTAIMTALVERGPTVIAMPGDVAASDALSDHHEVTRPASMLKAVPGLGPNTN